MLINIIGNSISSGGVVGGGGSGFDSDYQAVLDYGTSLGYTLPSVGQRTIQNQLMLELKAGGIWNKLDTFAVFATDGNSNFALIDWKRLTLYTQVNSPTFTINQGFQGNGTSSYISTNFNPATSGVNYTLNNASRFLWQKIKGLGTNPSDGVITANLNNITSHNSSGQRINTSNPLTTSRQVSVVGLTGLYRTSSLDVDCITNLTIFPNIALSTSINSNNQLIMRSGNSYSIVQASFYGMGASLTFENTDLYNALNTYLTSL